MEKLTILILLLLIVSCTREEGEKNTFSIDGYFEAYFPDQPILYTSLENKAGSFVFYNYQDEYNNVQYIALYITLKNKPNDNKGFLYQYIHSAAMSWNGNVVKFEHSKQDGNDEILYVSETIKADELVYEFGVVAIKDGIVFQWVVEERDDMVKADSLFGEKVKYFKVLK